MSNTSSIEPTVVESNGRTSRLGDDETFGVGGLAADIWDESPYTDDKIIYLDVGPTATRFHIHRALLTQSEVLHSKPASQLWGEKNSIIALPDLDKATAHTLVHYLYSGRYQSLRLDDTSAATPLPRYKLATCAFCAAVRYKLPGLADLAKLKITSLDESLSILDILSVARENAFPGLPESETWYAEYVQHAIKRAAESDPELFTKALFADQVEGDRRYKQVVLNAIVSTYQARAATGSSRGVPSEVDGGDFGSEGVGGSIPRTNGDAGVKKPETVPESIIEEVSTKPTQMVDETPAFEAIEPAMKTEPGQVEKEYVGFSIPQASEPPSAPAPAPASKEAHTTTTTTPAKPDPATDELGYTTSKTYQALSQPSSSPFVPTQDSSATAPVPITLPHRPAHKRNDSAVGSVSPQLPSSEEPSVSVEVEKKGGDSATSAADGAVAAVAPGGEESPAVPAAASKSAKKKKGKKSKKAEVAAISATAAAATTVT